MADEMRVDKLWDTLEMSRLVEKGGPGSGHWGHAGRPGERGGSASMPSDVEWWASDAEALKDLNKFTSLVGGKYPAAGGKVDGRAVLDADNVPNLASIDADVGHLDYEELPGIRSVPMADFPGITGRTYSATHNRSVRELQQKIQDSNAISPLIVVVDEKGPYILEGSHRIDALFNIGAKKFPAVVVATLSEGE